jgi:uncharacterized OsmC-like protein
MVSIVEGPVSADEVSVLFGDLSDEERHRLLEIAERCPVHRTLVSEVQICTRLIADHPAIPITTK